MKNLIKIFTFIILLIWIIWIIIYSNYQSFKTKKIVKKTSYIEINRWDNFKSLSNKIEWINDFYLWIYLNKNIPNYELQAGKYKVNTWATISEIIENLNKPVFTEEKITFLEWWNIYDIDDYLNYKWFINKWDYIDYVTNIQKIKALSRFYNFIKNQKTLEWYLYPDTYKITTPLKINKLVIKQLDNFENKVYNKILTKYDNKTIEDIINLASIVEKEEKNPKEKSTVAWILKKRLNSGWKIWADITVCYPHKLTSEECKMVVSKYINEKNEYNTRTMLWLPKTPIWNPSFETINATLNDKKTNYWFYLHNVKSWKIYYWETNAEHEANKKYMY